MTPHGQAVALEWYEAGVTHGIARGYEKAERELSALQRAAVLTARQAAQGERYDVLLERRGDPERAAEHRALLAERGI
jgi:hypothetical protein